MSGQRSRSALVIPYGEDLATAAASVIIERCVSDLPHLDHVAVLVPELTQSARLRSRLVAAAAARGHPALLGPRVQSLSLFLADLPLGTAPTLASDARELLLLEALRRHTTLFGDADLWRLARDLLALFDELNLQRTPLPEELAPFRALLQRAYAIPGQAPAHLSREAQIVHTLWRAWHEQLDADATLDHPAWLLQALSQSLQHIDARTRLFAVGFSALRPAERDWLGVLMDRGQAELIVHGEVGGHGYHPDAPLQQLLQQLGAQPQRTSAATPRSQALGAAFDHQVAPLQQRAARLRQAHPHSPLSEHLSVFAAADSEQEARAVDLQVRQWLLDDVGRIGVVTEDRRLARRVRALLERAGVVLADTAGWALSTTSSATVIERWLQSVEEDFAHQPMMDLLKSPFLLPADDDAAESYRRAIYRLEQDLILHENIARGLDRYRTHLRYRQRRLGWSTEAGAAVEDLLNRLQQAARPLQALLSGGARPLSAFVRALLDSLDRLEVLGALNADAAGARIMQQLDRLQQAAEHRPLDADWIGFRGWLGAALERSHFQPPNTHTRVQLLSLEQTTLAGFDAVVLAGAEREHLPGQPPLSPYFNDAVRRELGLPTWRDRLALRLHYFRRLLESAPRVLITHRREQDGEELLPSPWLEAVQALHQQAWNDDLSHRQMAAWLADDRTQVASPDPAPLPTPAANPRVEVPAERLPECISAAAQQRLIDCPYQFFAADCLGLKPVEEVREALQKSDYGERVHRCLEAFHGGVSGLPGPFGARLEATNREQAEALLRQIAEAVFAQDLEDNFIHRGWLDRWLARIPEYVAWQLAREAAWRPAETERSVERPLAGPWRLRGRLDRVDRNAEDRSAVIDYKTGAVPGADQVSAGEAVQLISYALLLEDVDQVEYLQLDQRVRTLTVLQGDELATLRAAVRERLIELLTAISKGTPLPAWGDPETCSHCRMAGLCRRQTWDGPAQ